MRPYERFLAWRLTHELALAIREASKAFPSEERFALTVQIRRAALSAPTNIAEGSAKRGGREFRRFLDIALGSLMEVAYLLRFARDAGVMDQEAWRRLDVQQQRASIATWKLYKSVSQTTQQPTSMS